MASDPLDQVAALIEVGRLAKARAVLKPIIQAKPHIPRAWLLEAQTWPEVDAKIKLLRLALECSKTRHAGTSRRLPDINGERSRRRARLRDRSS